MKTDTMKPPFPIWQVEAEIGNVNGVTDDFLMVYTLMGAEYAKKIAIAYWEDIKGVDVWEITECFQIDLIIEQVRIG